MKRALLPLLGLLALAFSCEPELSLDEALKGRRCRDEEPRCVLGYVCEPKGNVCVLPSSLEAGGSAGSSGASLATSGGSSGSGNAGGASGTTDSSVGGAAGVSAGSAGMTSVANAGSESVLESEPDAGALDDPDASSEVDGGCTPGRVFRDRDGDGFGSDRPEDQSMACPTPPGFVSVGGDCFDAVPTPTDRADLVHPGQTDFFPTGYHLDPNDFESDSFDYDCSGEEEPDPDNAFPAGAPDCESLDLPCIGSGFLIDRNRSGPGTLDVCGAEIARICVPDTNRQCISDDFATDPFRCH